MINTEQHKSLPATLFHRITGAVGTEEVKTGVAELIEMLRTAVQTHGTINLIIDAKGVRFTSLEAHKTWSLGLEQYPALKRNISRCAFVLDDSPNARAEKELMESERLKFFFELDQGVMWLRDKTVS